MNDVKEKFYKKMWFIVLMLVFIPPVGLILMWVFKKPQGKIPRIVMTVIFGLWCIGWFGSAGGDSESTSTTVPETKVVQHAETTTSEVEVKTDEVVEEVENEPEEQQEEIVEPEPVDDFSDVEKVYELSTGHYVAGIDIPEGKCNITAVEGTGNLSSSNLYSGGINEMFGIDDGSGFYVDSFNGLKLPIGETLSVSGKLTIKLEYTTIEGRALGRTYDEANAIELGSGNYTAGVDFTQGIYRIEAVSGTGNLSSSNVYEGGVNEMFGIDDGTGFYTDKVEHVTLSEGVELSISGGVKVRLVPTK